MEGNLHATYCADLATHHVAEVIASREIARDTYRLRLACPAIANKYTPGQFVMVRLHGWNDPLLGRALAVYDSGSLSAGELHDYFDVVYIVKGKFTSRAARLQPGTLVDAWGPLGNGFKRYDAEHLIMVAGGIGQTPFLSLAQEATGQRSFPRREATGTSPKRITYCYGARSAEHIACLEDFAALPVDILISTNDGSRGQPGYVTQLLEQTINSSDLHKQVVCCGPEPMMAAVSQLCSAAGVACDVSLETPMACGIGICFTCVAQVRDAAGQVDYKRTCVEGPVFPAETIVW